jgi:hypothetical protein
VVAVVIALHGVAFGGRVPSRYKDLLGYFFPNGCFLGRMLRSGHIPAWNPYAMGGTPFTGDPQSGWMYLPPMAMFTLLPCGLALRAFIVVHPIMAGLGVYGFLRVTKASRPAALVGGIGLAVGMASTSIVWLPPLAGVLAWIAVMLACAARLVRASEWPGRLLWSAVTALAWGQAAAAMLSFGLVLGAGALAAYLGPALVGEVKRRRVRASHALILAGVVAVMLPAVNLAYLLPRLAFLPRSSLGLGFRHLQELAAQFSGRPPPPFRVEGAAGSAWPLRLSNAAGLSLGGAGVVLSFGAFWNRRRRALAIGLAGYGLACYLASLRVVAEALRPFVRSSSLLTFYWHIPSRFEYGTILVLPILAALGLDAWREAPSWTRRAGMAAPGVIVWVFLPLFAGLRYPHVLLTVAGLAVTTALLVAIARRPALVVAVPCVLALELVCGSVLAGRFIEPGRFGPPAQPDVSIASLVRKDAIDRTLRGEEGRLMTVDVREIDQRTTASLRSILFGVAEAQGYNPAQLRSSWEFVRAANGSRRMDHNSSLLLDPSPVALDLLRVGWALSPAGIQPKPDWLPVMSLNGWTLWRLAGPHPAVSVVTSWEVAAADDRALSVVMKDGFDPEAEAVVSGDPGIAPSLGAIGSGPASYRPRGTQAASVSVDVEVPALVVIRNAYDVNWHATVDGRPAPLLRADYLVQAVPVPAGRHQIELRYDDPWTGYGLGGEAAALALVLCVAFLLRRRPATAASDGITTRERSGRSSRPRRARRAPPSRLHRRRTVPPRSPRGSGPS